MLTSKENDFIKFVRSLDDKKNRKENGLFILEGRKFVQDALDGGFQSKHIIQTQEHFEHYPFDPESVIVSDDLFRYISKTKTPQGILGLFEIPQTKFEDILAADKILFLENVQNSDNVGALIRSAVCAGYGAVVSSEGTADRYSDKAVRASAGSILNIISFDGGCDRLEKLKSYGYVIIGSSLEGNEKENMQFTKSVLVIGNEGGGMSSECKSMCDILVKIPIYGKCESLNAANAGTLLMYKTVGY